MLGSCKKCSNCHSSQFRRIKVNRAIQCENCKSILEERCLSDLTEYHAISQTEEVHCVVTPDFLHSHLVDDIPNDPYCTPGFISAFRMLSPIREPVYTATARTVSGSLAEMERTIGDALFAGYVGYNGRAPGGPVKKEEVSDPTDRNKSGGDARHTLVAYFEIIELASILFVDHETASLAIRIFRHTASNTSLRNRNVESLATAAFVAAVERRCWEYQQYVKTSQKANAATASTQPDVAMQDGKNAGADSSATEEKTSSKVLWPVPPRHVTVDEVATASNLEISEIQRNLKVVNEALRKQRPEYSSSITTHMPKFCKKLDLPDHTRRLAVAIVENATKLDLCRRRHPVSISAAAIYLACQLDGVRRTQAETCKAARLTEVTLRKVYKELNRKRQALIPDWFGKEEDVDEVQGNRPAIGLQSGPTTTLPKKFTVGIGELPTSTKPPKQNDGSMIDNGIVAGLSTSLIPPPLPPGFEAKERSRSPPPLQTAKGDGPPTITNEQPTTENDNQALVSIMNTPSMKALVNAFSMMPQMMMPPPPPPPPPPLPPPPLPPPLPPSLDEGPSDKMDIDTGEKGEKASSNDGNANDTTNSTDMANATDVAAVAPIASRPKSSGSMPATDTNPMVDFQSMMTSIAVDAFQKALQEQMASAGSQGSTASAMAAMMSQVPKNDLENLMAKHLEDAKKKNAQSDKEGSNRSEEQNMKDPKDGTT